MDKPAWHILSTYSLSVPPLRSPTVQVPCQPLPLHISLTHHFIGLISTDRAGGSKVRGLPYMTSAQRGGGVKKYPKFADKQYIEFKGGGELKILRTSYMEAPKLNSLLLILMLHCIEWLLLSFFLFLVWHPLQPLVKYYVWNNVSTPSELNLNE